MFINQAETYLVVKCRLLDTVQQEMQDDANKIYFLLNSFIKKIWAASPLFNLLKCPQDCRAFILARCNVMPIAVQYGRFKGVP